MDSTLGGGSGSGSGSGSAWEEVVARRRAELVRAYRYYLDLSAPHTAERWAGTAVGAVVYAVRVSWVGGFYLVTYGLAIYALNLLIAFLSPLRDPAATSDADPSLPTRRSDEFRPFVRRLPEFKFWYAITKALCVAFVMTFFPVFDFPAFWPILLFYWVFLFVMMMKRQIQHMIKYKYIPFNIGKKRYTGRKSSATMFKD